MEEEILKNLKEGNIDIFLRDIEKHTILLTSFGQGQSNQKIKLCCFIEELLHVLSTYLRQKESNISQVQEVVSKFEKCYQLYQESNCVVVNSTQTNRSFYHIIINLIRLSYHQEAIMISSYLFHNITQICMNDETETLINNLYITFWNSAIELEQREESFCSVLSAFSLRMRRTALRFLSLKHSHFQKVCEQSSKALIWYISKTKNGCCKDEIVLFCTEVWHSLIKSHKSAVVKDTVITTVKSLFVMLKDWIRILIRYVTLQNIPLDLLTNLEDILNLMKAAKDEIFVSVGSASIIITEYCIKLLKMFQANSFKNCEDWNIDDIKRLETTLLNTESTDILSSVIDSAFSLCCYSLLEMLTLSETEESNFQSFNISYYITLVECIVTVFIKKHEYIWNKIDGQLIFASICKILGGTAMILRKEIQRLSNKDNIEDFIMKARENLGLLSSLLNVESKKYLLGKEYLYFGNEICNLGIVYFGKDMYREAIEYLELSSCYFSKILQLEKSPTPENLFVKRSLWKNHELLAHSYLATEQYEISLKVIIGGLVWNNFKVSSVIDIWIKIKREMNRKNISHFKKRTLKQEIEVIGIEVDKQSLIQLLFAELKAYRSERYDTGEECFNVATSLVNLSENSLDRACALIELTRLTWMYGDKYSFCIERSSIEYCMKAHEILKQLKPEGNNLITIKFLQSLANFWLYQVQIKNLQSAAQKEIEKLPSAPIEITSTLRGDEEDGAETCDISPAFSYLNIHIQQKAIDPLNQALQLWHELFEAKLDLTGVLSAQDLLELLDVIRTTAEIYTLYQKDVEELKAWNILRKAAIVLNNPVTELQSLSMLITILCRQCLLDTAKLFIEEGEHIMEKVIPLGSVDPYANLSKLKFQLAICKYLLLTEQFTEGLNMLWTILTSSVLERQTKSSMLLIAEAKMVLCHYSLLCPSVFSSVSKHALELIETSTPINLALDSIKLCIGLLKHIQSGENTVQEFPWYKLYLTRVFLDNGLLLGELYISIGAPKEARCFLCESLTTAQELILVNRAAAILILLAQLDLLCDNKDDCIVKLKGLTYILQFTNNCIEYHDAMQGKQSFAKDSFEAEECEKFLKNKPGRTLKGEVRHQLLHIENVHTSPTAKRQQKVMIPLFFNHSNTCSCQYCQYFSLHNCFLEVLSLQSTFIYSITKKKKLLEDALKYQQKLLLKRQNNLKVAVSFLFNEQEVKPSNLKRLTRSDLNVLCNIHNQLSVLATNQNKHQEALHYFQSAYLLLSSSCKLFEVTYANLFSTLIYNKTIIYLCYMISKNKIALNNFYVNELINNNQKENSSDASYLTEELKGLCLNNPEILPEKGSNLFSSPLKLPMKTPAKSLAKGKSSNYSKVYNAPRRKKVPNICLEAYINSLENVPLEKDNLIVFEDSCKTKYATSIKSSRKTRLQKQSQKILSDTKYDQCEQKICKLDSFEENIENSKVRKKRGNNFIESLNESALKPSRNILCERNDIYLFNVATKDNNLDSENEKESKKSNYSKKHTATDPTTSKKKSTVRKNTIPRKLILSREDIENGRVADSDNNLLLSPDFNLSDTPDTEYSLQEYDISDYSCHPVSLNKQLSNLVKLKIHTSPSEEFRTSDCSPSRIICASYSKKERAYSKNGENKMKHAIKSKKENGGKTENQNPECAIIYSAVSPHTDSIHKQDLLCSFEERGTGNTELNDITIEEIYSELKHAILTIRHNPPSPLYSKMCIIMSLFVVLMKKQKKNNIEDTDRFIASYYIAESAAVTLKHLATTALNKKIKKNMYILKEDTVQANSTCTSLETCADLLKQNLLNFRKNSNIDDSEEIKKMVDELPKEWTIVQVCALPTILGNSSQEHTPPTLLVTRFRAQSTPVSAVMDTIIDNAFTSNFLGEFNAILKESTATMEKIEAKVWWTVRKGLDSRMKSLIDSMENIWLGCWKGLFLGIPLEDSIKERLKGIALEVMALAEHFNLTCTDKYLLEVLLDSSHFLTDKQLSFAISYLWKCSTSDTRCKQLLLSIRKSAFDVNFGRINRHPVILILDKKVQALPWESMSLFHNQSVSRVPSLSLLHAQLATYNLQPNCIFRKGVDAQNTFYILNPSNDIPDTQLKFQDTFNRQVGWGGVIGRPPTQQEFSSALTDHDLFIYCGHGTGRVYLAAECIERLKCRATTILMGCSSGKLKTYGNQLEPNGVVLQYWVGGSPCIVANLWDVTDKDIDRFTESLLKSWLPAFEDRCSNYCGTFITDAIQSARRACRLPHLIGSAPVIYGLPVFTS